MSRWIAFWVFAGIASTGALGEGHAQDIEALAEIRGITLPREYYERVLRNPDVFELPLTWRGQRPQAVDGHIMPVAGRFQLLVIPALFADSEEPLFPVEEVRRVIFDGPSEAGTLTDFYLEASGGLLEVEGVVAPWVRTSLTVGEVVGESFGLGDNTGTGDFLVEAVTLADQVIDFTQFDNDGPDGVPNSGDDDGIVDVINFEFQEVAASCGGPAIWPHRSAMFFWLGGAALATQDLGFDGTPLLVVGYTITSAADCTGETLQTAGVVSHEFGHVLGLPDLYHPIDGIEPQNRRWVLGCWGLMAAGSWGCGDGSTRGDSFGPTHFSPWSKERLGWIQWIDVGDVFDQEFVLHPAQQSRQALRVPLDDEENEFLVVEYRPQTGFDAYLPSSGALMYHWDMEAVRRPDRGTNEHYRFAMVEADGRADLRLTALNGGNRGEASDAWGLDVSPVLLNSETSPGTRRHAGSAPSRVTIHAISVAGGEARVRLTNSYVPGIVEVGALADGRLFNPYTGRLTIAGGLMPYTAFMDDALPSRGMTVATDGMELVVGGAPELMGDFELSVGIEDSQGNVGIVVVPLTVGEFVMSLERALTAFLDSQSVPLNEGERSILDSRGNDNGFYDIGDLRAFLRGGA